MPSTTFTFLSELKGTDSQQWAAHQQLYPMNLNQRRYTKAAKSVSKSEAHIDDPMLSYFARLENQGIETPSKIQAMKMFRKEQLTVSSPPLFVYPIFNRALDISYRLGLRPKAKEQQNVDKEELDKVKDEFTKLAGIADLYLASTFPSLSTAATDNNQTELDSNIAICNILSSPCYCTNQCECKNSEYQE